MIEVALWVVAIAGGLVALFMIMSVIEWLVTMFLGFSQPKVQWLMRLRHWSKLLRGIKVVKNDTVCPDGYLYHRLTYSDGSSLLFR